MEGDQLEQPSPDSRLQAYEDVGTRLRAYRERAGIGVRELARRVGVSPSMISQIETGKTQPSVSTLYAVVSELAGSPVPSSPFAPGITPPATSGSSGASASQPAASGAASPASPTPQTGKRCAAEVSSLLWNVALAHLEKRFSVGRRPPFR